MYNVFKRPMFKLGGQADQGTGIMSHVEPRPTYMFGNIVQPLTPFQSTYTELPAYAYGGRIGYANGPGPVLPGAKQSTIPTFGQKEALEAMYGKDAIQNAYQKQVEQYKQDILGGQSQLGMFSQDPESSVYLPRIAEGIARSEKGLAALQSPEGKTAFEKAKIAEFNRIRQKQGLESLITEEPKEGGGEGNGTKEPRSTEAVKTDPREKIKEEAEMLKSLLRNENLTTAENALIIAKALGTPGGINAKIAAAGEMAIPVLRERAKIDKEAALEAYKTSKEIKKAEIAAGALTGQQKLIESQVRIEKNTAKNITKDPDGTIRYDGLTEDEIRDRIQAPIFGKYTAKDVIANEQLYAKLNKKIQDEIAKSKPDLNQIQKWQTEADALKKLFKFKANGGRINKATGGMSTEDTMVDDTTGDKTETVVETNVEGFPEKPVQKLTFEEIRNRLPREITDDIVRLLANSAEALQDFAYIKTQQDVNQFNVKYGVNLVLPQNA